MAEEDRWALFTRAHCGADMASARPRALVVANAVVIALYVPAPALPSVRGRMRDWRLPRRDLQLHVD